MKLQNRDRVTLEDFLEEIDRGVSKFGDYRSYHEAYAVILEEVDELWDELKKKEKDLVAVYSEAVQVAATAYRLAEEIRIAGKDRLVSTDK